ncbi:hypothetical protein EDC45_0123 [Mesocricetibacter intestinalis]|uniref:Uncharacterized protein n=1 Tax=Mesocricetibacter intestinalis TaxID=1521930 RepID=A0A4R6VER8_9PAST|nr:hypothetical protein EDC45_0123 [Mesocricetibacter intestinalis]
MEYDEKSGIFLLLFYQGEVFGNRLLYLNEYQKIIIKTTALFYYERGSGRGKG